MSRRQRSARRSKAINKGPDAPDGTSGTRVKFDEKLYKYMHSNEASTHRSFKKNGSHFMPSHTLAFSVHDKSMRTRGSSHKPGQPIKVFGAFNNFPLLSRRQKAKNMSEKEFINHIHESTILTGVMADESLTPGQKHNRQGVHVFMGGNAVPLIAPIENDIAPGNLLAWGIPSKEERKKYCTIDGTAKGTIFPVVFPVNRYDFTVGRVFERTVENAIKLCDVDDGFLDKIEMRDDMLKTVGTAITNVGMEAAAETYREAVCQFAADAVHVYAASGECDEMAEFMKGVLRDEDGHYYASETYIDEFYDTSVSGTIPVVDDGSGGSIDKKELTKVLFFDKQQVNGANNAEKYQQVVDAGYDLKLNTPPTISEVLEGNIQRVTIEIGADDSTTQNMYQVTKLIVDIEKNNKRGLLDQTTGNILNTPSTRRFFRRAKKLSENDDQFNKTMRNDNVVSRAILAGTLFGAYNHRIGAPVNTTSRRMSKRLLQVIASGNLDEAKPISYISKKYHKFSKKPTSRRQINKLPPAVQAALQSGKSTRKMAEAVARVQDQTSKQLLGTNTTEFLRGGYTSLNTNTV